MRRIWLAIALPLVVALAAVTGSAAQLAVDGGTLQVFTFAVDLGPIADTVDIDPEPIATLEPTPTSTPQAMATPTPEPTAGPELSPTPTPTQPAEPTPVSEPSPIPEPTPTPTPAP